MLELVLSGPQEGLSQVVLFLFILQRGVTIHHMSGSAIG